MAYKTYDGFTLVSGKSSLHSRSLLLNVERGSMGSLLKNQTHQIFIQMPIKADSKECDFDCLYTRLKSRKQLLQGGALN